MQPKLQRPSPLLDQGCKIQALPNVELAALPVDHEPIEPGYGLAAKHVKHHQFPIQFVEGVPVLILHWYEILLTVVVGVRRHCALQVYIRHKIKMRTQ